MELTALMKALWKYRFWIAGSSILPALALGLFIYFGPRAYYVQLEYQIDLDAVSYKKMVDRFYAAKNIAAVAEKLKAQEHHEIAQALLDAEGHHQLAKIIDFSITPGYIDFENKEKLKLSLERSWAENITKLEQLRAQLITVTLTTASAEDALALAQGFADNFETELPLFDAYDERLNQVRHLNSKIAEITGKLHEYQIQRKTLTGTLSELNQVKEPISSSKMPLELHFNAADLDQSRIYLPIAQQRLAIESAIIHLDHEKSEMIETRGWFTQILEVNYQLLDFLKAPTTGGESLNLERYSDELEKLTQQAKTIGVLESLRSHSHFVDNLALMRQATVPLGKATPQARGTIKTTAMAFIILFILACLITAFAEVWRREAI